MAALCAAAAPAGAATFVVTSTLDAVDESPGDGVCAAAGGVCTLRAAVQEAEALAGDDLITLPAGTYTLTIQGTGEVNSAAGDLNIRSHITISGAGAAATIIDAAGIDRVFSAFSGATLTVSGVTIRNGDGTESFSGFGGGGILMFQGTRLVVTHAVITANTATNGGGIAVIGNQELPSSITVSDTTIVHNVAADGLGGGVYLNTVGAATISRTVVSSNTAAGSGGGLLVTGAVSLFVTDTAITGNTGATGAGVSIFSPLVATTISRTAVSGNTATAGVGGGIAARGALAIANSTISGNSAPIAGGAIYQADGTMGIINTTIASNASGFFASIGVAGAAQFKNALIANATGAAPINCGTVGSEGSLTTFGNNLEFPGTSCGFTLPTDRRADPLLAPLADNGGPTLTHAVPLTSPAVDAGDAAACAGASVMSVDQRGFARPKGVRCDIGAYEADDGGFTDDPLVSGAVSIRAIHVIELRMRIDALRVRFGLQPFTWTDGTLIATLARAIHVQQLRDALVAAYEAAIAAGSPVAVPTFIDHPLTVQVTTIRAIHIEQLRAAVRLLEGL